MISVLPDIDGDFAERKVSPDYVRPSCKSKVQVRQQTYLTDTCLTVQDKNYPAVSRVAPCTLMLLYVMIKINRIRTTFLEELQYIHVFF